jgi:hypothetical protein
MCLVVVSASGSKVASAAGAAQTSNSSAYNAQIHFFNAFSPFRFSLPKILGCRHSNRRYVKAWALNALTATKVAENHI